MEKVYRLPLLGVISLFGASLVVSHVHAITQDEVNEAKNKYQTAKKIKTNGKTPEVLELKYKFKKAKAQFNYENVTELLKDDSQMGSYFSKRANDLEKALTKAKNRPTKTFKQDKVEKLENDLTAIQKAISGSSSEKIAYLEGRSKASSTRVTAMTNKLAKLNSKK